MTNKKTQRYKQEFRQEAVKLAEHLGNTVSSVGNEPGFSAQRACYKNLCFEFNRKAGIPKSPEKH